MIRVSSDGRLVGSEAIASPAGSNGVGGLFSCRGALEGADRILPCCRICVHLDKRKGRAITWALTLNEWRQWACDRQSVIKRGINERKQDSR